MTSHCIKFFKYYYYISFISVNRNAWTCLSIQIIAKNLSYISRQMLLYMITQSLFMQDEGATVWHNDTQHAVTTEVRTWLGSGTLLKGCQRRCVIWNIAVGNNSLQPLNQKYSFINEGTLIVKNKIIIEYFSKWASPNPILQLSSLNWYQGVQTLERSTVATIWLLGHLWSVLK